MIFILGGGGQLPKRLPSPCFFVCIALRVFSVVEIETLLTGEICKTRLIHGFYVRKSTADLSESLKPASQVFVVQFSPLLTLLGKRS